MLYLFLEDVLHISSRSIFCRPAQAIKRARGQQSRDLGGNYTEALHNMQFAERKKKIPQAGCFWSARRAKSARALMESVFSFNEPLSYFAVRAEQRDADTLKCRLVMCLEVA